MEKLKIYLTWSRYQDEALLGKRVREYVEREFNDLDCTVIEGLDEICLKDELDKYGAVCVLSLACPLISVDHVRRAVKGLRLKGASRVEFEHSSAFIVRKGGDGKTIFADNSAFFEINSAKSYSLVYNKLKDRIIDRHLSCGVVVLDRATTFIDDTVEIGADAKILPFCRIEGRSVISSGATISATYLKDSTVHSGAVVESSHIVDSIIGEGAMIGPFARLRGANIGKGCRIGDFVEVKQSSIGDGTKSAHLTYIGDAMVGERTNIGCGTVFCNYDGSIKHPTRVGNDCFIGANVNLVAPISIGDDCFIAAGTTITHDLADGMFAIGRQLAKTTVNKRKNNI